MLDLTWKIFSQTGNIEAYLLLKDLEDEKVTLYEDENKRNDSNDETKEETFELH